MKKLSKKILFSTLIFLSLSLIFFYNNKGVFGQEPTENEEPISVCVEPLEVDIPDVQENIPLMDNKLEMPIGKSVDFTESMAEEIIDAINPLCSAAESLAANTESLSSLVNEQFTAENCKPQCKKKVSTFWGCSMAPCENPCNKCPSCPPIQPYCCCYTTVSCEKKPCEESAAWLQAEIDVEALVNQIEGNASTIRSSYSRIEDFFALRFTPMYLYWHEQFWEYGSQPLSYYATIPWLSTNPMVSDEQASKDICHTLCFVLISEHCELCTSPAQIEIAVNDPEKWNKGKLEKSRERLKECVVEITEELAEEREEIVRKLLEDCKIAMPVPLEACYGNTYCEACEKVPAECQEGRLGPPPGEGLPEPPLTKPSKAPCGENFFCCFEKEKL